jgi:hypothetical protein
VMIVATCQEMARRCGLELAKPSQKRVLGKPLYKNKELDTHFFYSLDIKSKDHHLPDR